MNGDAMKENLVRELWYHRTERLAVMCFCLFLLSLSSLTHWWFHYSYCKLSSTIFSSRNRHTKHDWPSINILKINTSLQNVNIYKDFLLEWSSYLLFLLIYIHKQSSKNSSTKTLLLQKYRIFCDYIRNIAS